MSISAESFASAFKTACDHFDHAAILGLVLAHRELYRRSRCSSFLHVAVIDAVRQDKADFLETILNHEVIDTRSFLRHLVLRESIKSDKPDFVYFYNGGWVRTFMRDLIECYEHKALRVFTALLDARPDNLRELDACRMSKKLCVVIWSMFRNRVIIPALKTGAVGFISALKMRGVPDEAFM